VFIPTSSLPGSAQGLAVALACGSVAAAPPPQQAPEGACERGARPLQRSTTCSSPQWPPPTPSPCAHVDRRFLTQLLELFASERDRLKVGPAEGGAPRLLAVAASARP
jgi:hypothetical protein